jgi:TatD DNase family protein
MPSAFSPREGGYYSVGIHPWNIDSTTESEYECLKKIASHPQIIAIGEAGLDKMIPVDLSIQKEIFRLHIKLSETFGKPLIIHSVKTSNEIIQLKKEFCPKSPWIIHGFRGKKELADQLIAHGIYLSFGEKYQESAINSIPLDHLLLETDESNRTITEIFEAAAQSRSVPVEQLITQVQQNISRLFFNQ